ncbi:MAG TPA: hypothetical protein VKT52_06410 [Ktedonobacterales bacterium]|nr:hypothetical protein [Ktedonobacterales bacterium]
MTPNDAIKRAHELAVAQRFVEFLRGEGFAATEPRSGDIARREPDAVFDLDGDTTGIEVACAYYDDEEARDTWSIARGHPEQSRRLQQPGEEIRETIMRSRVLTNPDEALGAALNRTLQAHAAKTYSVPTFLVLDGYGPQHAALTTDADSPRVLGQIHAPRRWTFRAVYVSLTNRLTNQPVFLPLPG